MKNIAILGAGSWGTALSILLCGNGHNVTVWSIDPEEVLMLKDYREHNDELLKLFNDSLSTFGIKVNSFKINYVKPI